MVLGTALAGLHGFSSVVDIRIGPFHAPVHVVMTALAVNLVTAAVLPPLLGPLGVPRGHDSIASGAAWERRGSKYAFVVE